MSLNSDGKKQRYKPVYIAAGALIYAAILAIIGLAGLVLYWWSQGPVLFDMKASMISDTVQRGIVDNGKYHFVGVKLRKCPARSTEVIVDSNKEIHTFADEGGVTPIGVVDRVYPFTVPQSAALGEACYYRAVVYRCNPIFYDAIDTPPACFEVVE